MKQTKFGWLAVAAVLGLGVAQPAIAADMPVKAAPVVYNWTGFYVGGSIGWQSLDAKWSTSGLDNGAGVFVAPDPTTTPASFDSSTLRFGGYLGYNWQLAPQWLVGVEGDIATGSHTKSQGGIPGTFGTSGIAAGPGAANHDNSSVKSGWDASIRGRIGMLIAPNWLIYGTGGVAFQNFEVGAACDAALTSWCLTQHTQSFSTVRSGWTVGGGVEVIVARNWLARAQYRYSDFGTYSNTFFPAGSGDQVKIGVSLRTSTVLGGIAYKF